MFDATQYKHPIWPGVSEPVENADLRVLSLGAGVQSTTLALMAAHGEIGPMPDLAIFADTGWEPKAVYEHLDWLSSGNVLPFPIHRVKAVDLRAQVQARADRAEGRFVTIPYFLGQGGMNRRQCTREAKIDPIRAEVRRLLGVPKGARATAFRVEQWIGISTDEMERIKDAPESWITHRWPLIEARMSRGDCSEWCKRHGYPEPPKSACIGCPFRTNARWLELSLNDPDAFSDAVALDAAMRRNGPAAGMRALEYMHRSCRPLGDIDFEAETGGPDFDFRSECDGVCGT